MRFATACGTALVAGACLLHATPVSAEVQLAIRDGRVTLVATDATVRQILTEWARVGQTRIVNVDRIPGGPVTLELTGVPEAEALDLLLRSVTGYMAAQRPVVAANQSRYDRILVLPTAAVTRVPVTTPPGAVFQQPFQQQFPSPADGGNDDGPSIPPQRGPLFQTMPSQQPPGMPQVINDQQFNPSQPAGEAPNGQAPNAPFPGASSVGTPRPGMVIPSPAQPGPGGQQPGQPVPVEN
jgi:hypothetical protein